MNVPRCYGIWRDPAEGVDVLVLEYVDGVHAHRTPDQVEGMALAAGWIAHLYRYWTARTRDFERRTLADRAWLMAFCDRIDRVSTCYSACLRR